MLSEKQKEKLRNRTAEVVLQFRDLYLRTPQVNVLKHWNQLEARVKAAARTCGSVEAWATKLQRDLQIENLGKDASQGLIDLASTVREMDGTNEWLSLVEDELGYIMALTRLAAEKRAEMRQEERNANEAV